MLVKAKNAAKKSPARKKPAAPPRNGDGPSSNGDKDLNDVYKSVTASPEAEHLEDWVGVLCPYCGEEFEVHVTSEQDGQTMYEDCEVCCRPVSLHIQVEEGELQVEGSRS